MFCHEWKPTSFTVLFRKLVVALLLNHMGGAWTFLRSVIQVITERKRSGGPPTSSKQGQPECLAQCCIQTGSEYLQGQSDLFWSLKTLTVKGFFPVRQFAPTASCPFTEHCLPLSSLLPHQEFIHLTYGYNPPGSLHPQAEQSQLSQPQFHCVSDAPSSSSSKQPFAGLTPVHPRLSGTEEPSTDTALQLWPQQNSEEKDPPPLICWHCSS